MKTMILILLAAFVLNAQSIQSRHQSILGMYAAAGSGGGIPDATAHYLFNNDATDETANNHDLTAEAGFEYSTTRIEGTHSGQFNADDYVSIADDIDFDPGTGDWSISCWFRATWLGTTLAVVGKVDWNASREGYAIWIEGSNVDIKIWDASDVTTVATTPTLSTDTWYHLVVAYDASAANEVQIWLSTSAGTFGDQINGTQYDCDRTPTDGGSAAWAIGYSGVDELPFYGQIDDVRWWKGTALDATQAEALYDLY